MLLQEPSYKRYSKARAAGLSACSYYGTAVVLLVSNTMGSILVCQLLCKYLEKRTDADMRLFVNSLYAQNFSFFLGVQGFLKLLMKCKTNTRVQARTQCLHEAACEPLLPPQSCGAALPAALREGPPVFAPELLSFFPVHAMQHDVDSVSSALPVYSSLLVEGQFRGNQGSKVPHILQDMSGATVQQQKRNFDLDWRMHQNTRMTCAVETPGHQHGGSTCRKVLLVTAWASQLECTLNCIPGA